MSLRLAFICHAPTKATRTASFPNNEPLDEPGLAKAQAVSPKFRAGTGFVRSPALAAKQTAEAFNVPAEAQPELRELDYGSWSGVSLQAIESERPESLSQWLADPLSCPHGGESMLALFERISTWLAKYQDQSGHLVAISHASVVRAAVISAIAAPPSAFWRIDVSPLSITRLQCSRGVWNLSSTNQRLKPYPAIRQGSEE